MSKVQRKILTMCYYDKKKPVYNSANNLSLNNLVRVRVVQIANKNQFAIYYKDDKRQLVAFQSYNTLICWLEGQKLYINYSMWDYSKTTSKHLKIFINEYTMYNYENHLQFAKEIATNENFILFEE